MMHILGDVKGKNAVIIDDICATAGSLIEAVEALKKQGVKDVYAAVSHGILSGNALTKVNNCKSLKQLVVTDSIPFSSGAKKNPKIKIVSIAPLLAEAIHRINGEESISCLFDEARG